MQHVHQNVSTEGPLHSRLVRPRTPPSASLENDPYHHVVETPQYQAAPAQYEAVLDDLILMLLIRIKLILVRLRLLKMIRLILCLLIHLIILLILCQVNRLGWTCL